jgi:hypothetical protein
MRPLPVEFAAEPVVLGEFGKPAVDRVLYGELRDDPRRVLAQAETPEGIRRFLTVAPPPLPLLFAEYPDLPPQSGYRRGWLIGPDRVRVDAPAERPGMRRLLFEPLADLLTSDLSDCWSGRAGTRMRLLVAFPRAFRWEEERKPLRRTTRTLVGEPLTGDERIHLDLRIEVTAGDAAAHVTEEHGPGVRDLPPLGGTATAEQVAAHVRTFLDLHWFRCLPADAYDAD